MDLTNYKEISEITRRQEEILRFDRFNARDAWDLGSFLVKRVYEAGIDMSIAIRLVNGYILFQHCTENTALNNQNWMRRKFNAVITMNKCSLRCWADANLSGEDLEAHGLNSTDYVFCGGGFPIRLKSGEMVAVLTVSNLPHEQDHQFIIDGLTAYLQAKDVPV